MRHNKQSCSKQLWHSWTTQQFAGPLWPTAQLLFIVIPLTYREKFGAKMFSDVGILPIQKKKKKRVKASIELVEGKKEQQFLLQYYCSDHACFLSNSFVPVEFIITLPLVT